MNCPMCQSPIKTVPAGLSKKNGKPYPSFMACTNPACKWTQNITPPAQPTSPAPIPTAPVPIKDILPKPQITEKQREERITKLAIAKSCIEAGKDMSLANEWLEWVKRTEPQYTPEMPPGNEQENSDAVDHEPIPF